MELTKSFEILTTESGIFEVNIYENHEEEYLATVKGTFVSCNKDGRPSAGTQSTGNNAVKIKYKLFMNSNSDDLSREIEKWIESLAVTII